MYLYLKNTSSGSPISEEVDKDIADELKRLHIAAPIKTFTSEAELSQILSGIDKLDTNTIAIIGSDSDFETLIGQIGQVPHDVAIGYIPTGASNIGHKLLIKSWKSGIEALAQRKINEVTIYSLGNRYFFDNITLSFEPNTAIAKPIGLSVDASLDLRLPDCTLEFENISDNQYLIKKPIQLRASSSVAQDPKSKKDLLAGLIKRISIKAPTSSRVIASLHGKVFKVQAIGQITDNYGRIYKNSVTIGKSTKKIRLISRKINQTD